MCVCARVCALSICFVLVRFDSYLIVDCRIFTYFRMYTTPLLVIAYSKTRSSQWAGGAYDWNGLVVWHNYCMRGSGWCGSGGSTDINMGRIRNRETAWAITRQRLPVTTLQLSGGYSTRAQQAPKRFD